MTGERARAMVVSLGGSPEPIIVALDAHRPEFVVFVASQRSIDAVGEILGRLAFDPQANEKVLVEDPEDLAHCYDCALAALDRVRRQRIRGEDTVIDYTGGTKVMSAALALAAAREGVRFSYVGGSVRTKKGLGQVVSGTETPRVSENPWTLFAVEERRLAAAHFARHEYEAAAAVLRGAAARATRDRAFLEALEAVAEGFACWDRFQHQEAQRQLGPAAKRLRAYCDASGRRGLRLFLDRLDQNVAFLEGMRATPERPCGDLFANALRRLEQRRFDDAVARLYRCIELRGQIAFREQFGCETGAVLVDRLPALLRDDYARRYGGQGEGLRLPLTATYEALAEAGHDLGVRFRAQRAELRKVLDARNRSILAHGCDSVEEATAERMREITAAFLADIDVPVFARLPDGI